MSDDETKHQRRKPRLKYLEDANHDRYRRSKKHELRLAEELGGRRLANSGGKLRSRWSKVGKVSNVSFRGEKPDDGFKNITLDGDFVNKKYHFEHKRTETKSIRVEREWLEKVSDGASARGTIPALVLTFETKRLGVADSEWACIPLDVFKRLSGQE
jgi:hypothetical protein